MMNFFKGTGINGLKGILPKNEKIVRPLLFAGKEELIAFAKKHKLEYREDSSNSSVKYTRNYFRNELLPGIEKVFPGVQQNLIENAERFRDIQALYNHSVDLINKKLLVKQAGSIYISVLKLLKTPAFRSVLYEVIKHYNFNVSQLDEVLKLLESETGKYIQSSSHRILRNRKWLIISPLNNVESSHIIIEKETKGISFEKGKIKMEMMQPPFRIDSNANVAQVDLSEITFPLLLRKWKQGDYFYPLGMRKKKKISRFFIDQKLSLDQKESAWLIESNKKIVWIAGMRIDDRFKITDKTRSVLKLTLVTE
jgi:tRNA(Ile)-lysidine synthase